MTRRKGPDKVGDCLENQRFNPENGDALQQTTGGLLVWRKADNWTAFTDGYRTWINGPYGLQARLNTEQFDWEGPPALTVEQLKNAEYQVDGYGEVRLTDGNYEYENNGNIEYHEKWITVGLAGVLFGDLNGDGVDDAAVILSRNHGGSGLFFDLAAVVNVQGQPRHVSSAFLGTLGGGIGFRVESMGIEGGRIVVRMIDHGPTDLALTSDSRNDSHLPTGRRHPYTGGRRGHWQMGTV